VGKYFLKPKTAGPVLATNEKAPQARANAKDIRGELATPPRDPKGKVCVL